MNIRITSDLKDLAEYEDVIVNRLYLIGIVITLFAALWNII
jgi:hypothetical protein